MQNVIYYIGPFPPAYGGVTIKNKNLFQELNKDLDIRQIDLNKVKRGNLKEILRFVWATLVGKQYVIGVSTQKNCCIVTKFLYRNKRRALKRSVLMVMGGMVDVMTNAGTEFVQMLNTYRKIFVELPGMLNELEMAGVRNVGIYPNGRPRPGASTMPNICDKPLRCLFFSIIRPEKGFSLVLQAAQMLPHMQFHFYGELREDCKQSFLDAVKTIENVTYHGVFTGDAVAVYQEISQYDVLLLPTWWRGEGLPGILIEAKIAGLPVIVSDHNFNKEIVTHNFDGLVIQDITAEKIVAALKDFDENSEKLLNMKLAAKAEAEKYYIDAWAPVVVRELERE